MKAIAAMASNRVIGAAGHIPWHLPEDFRWFRQATAGGVLVMGRKTFASIGKPLPGRLSVVVTRGPAIEMAGVETISDPGAFQPEAYAPREVWVAGGAEIYAQMLPRCTELYLSLVEGEFSGDTFFPEFEHLFDFAEIVLQRPEFVVRKYVRETSDAA
jgi:dihydrofolate reductase